jgi:hypothetical protein
MAVEMVVSPSEATKRGPGLLQAITEEVERDLMRSVELGLTIHDACIVAGISEATFYKHNLRNEFIARDDTRCLHWLRQPNGRYRQQ